MYEFYRKLGPFFLEEGLLLPGGERVSGVDLCGSRFEMQTLKNLSVDWSLLLQASLRRASIDSSVFQHCCFANCSFENATLRDIEFRGCVFLNCNLRRATGEGCSFVNSHGHFRDHELFKEAAVVNCYCDELSGLFDRLPVRDFDRNALDPIYFDDPTVRVAGYLLLSMVMRFASLENRTTKPAGLDAVEADAGLRAIEAVQAAYEKGDRAVISDAEQYVHFRKLAFQLLASREGVPEWPADWRTRA